jgi:diguanylate cyclase (GGDEF)-like protein
MKNTSAILIADSLPDNISALNSLLADKFTIYEANNLDELFSSLKKNVNIAVLILNVSLVHGKADVFIKAFKSNPLFSHIQIILLSYEITTGLEKTSLSADGAYFLHMPYSSPSLITECVNKAVNALHDVTVKNFINDVEDNPMYLGSMTKLLPCGIATFEVKNDHVITTAFNDAFCAMSNRTREEYLDYVKDDTLNIVYQEDRKVLLKDFYTSLRENKDIHTACRFIDKSGQIKWSKITARVFGSKNGTINCIATFLDVTEEKKINELLQYQTEHDELTGVLNRETFFKKTAEMLKSKVNVQHVLLRTNIENLKVVNEMLGSETGDRMLKAVVKELSKWVDDDGTLGRLHSDHFVACMPLKHFNISYIKKRLPHIFDELNINYNAIVSIGIYEITDINVPISQMCDRAYLSMAWIFVAALIIIAGHLTHTKTVID